MPTKVDVLIPSYRSLNPHASQAIAGMINATVEAGFDVKMPAVFASGVIHWTRNESINAIRPDADYVLMCDDDMLPEPDALKKLLKRKLNAVSAHTVSRGIPVKISAKAYDAENDLFYAITAGFKEDHLYKGAFGVGTGFLLLKRSVIDAVKEFWLSAEDWVADHRKMFDRLNVHEDNICQERDVISAARRSVVKVGGRIGVFHFWTNTETGWEFGEDISFSRRLIQLGYEIGIDTGVSVGHIGDFPYGPWNIGETDPRKVKLT